MILDLVKVLKKWTFGSMINVAQVDPKNKNNQLYIRPIFSNQKQILGIFSYTDNNVINQNFKIQMIRYHAYHQEKTATRNATAGSKKNKRQ